MFVTLMLIVSLTASGTVISDNESASRARYYFFSDVEDETNDLQIHRQESRDGMKVKGSYGYSDGFHKRHVTYEADQNGYRIIRDEIEPILGLQLQPPLKNFEQNKSRHKTATKLRKS